MKQQIHGLKWSRRLDYLLALVLFVFGFTVGICHLSMLDRGKSAVRGIELLYGPAVMMAYGHGFISPNVHDYPELRSFLRGDIESFPYTSLPETVVELRSDVAFYHRYLLYTTAVFWRLFGVSWKSLEPLLALLLAWCAVAIYGLMRMGIGKTLSTLCAMIVVMSPAMLNAITELRDFSRAPFILTILWILVWLLTSKHSLGRAAAAAAFLGVLTGISLGFRQDVLILTPPSVIALFFVGCRAAKSRKLMGLLPVILYLFCFLVFARPILTRMEGSAGPDHLLVQGFSIKRMDNLGLYADGYKPLSSGLDDYVFAAMYDYGRRVHRPAAPHFERVSSWAERSSRAWLIDMGMHFPADLLIRGYASVLRTLRYADAYPPFFEEPTQWHRRLYDVHRALAAHLHRAGPLYGVAVLLIIAAKNYILTLGLFIFVLYMFGYVGLQCEYRHAFHLSFAPFWIIAFLLQNILSYGCRIYSKTQPIRPCSRRTAVHVFLFALCCVFILGVPLYGLRYYQNYRVAKLLEPYLNAPCTPLSTTPSNQHGWTLFSVDAVPSSNQSDMRALCEIITCLISPELRLWHARSRYVVAEFETDTPLNWLILKYESDIKKNNYSQLIPVARNAYIQTPTLDSTSHEAKNVTRVFLPIYELLMPDAQDELLIARNRFVGIAVPETHASSFKGLYEITNLADCRFLMTLNTKGNRLPRPLYHRIRLIPDPLNYYQSETNAVEYLGALEAAKRFNRVDEAIFFARAFLLLSQSPENRRVVVDTLVEIEAWDAALEGALDIRDQEGVHVEGVSNILRLLGATFSALKEPEKADQALSELIRINPKAAPEASLEIAHAYALADYRAKAFEHFSALAAEWPAYYEGLERADFFLLDQYSEEERGAFWHEAVENAPAQSLPWLYLGHALGAMNKHEEAAKAYAEAHKFDTASSEAAIFHALYCISKYDHQTALERIHQYLDASPEYTVRAASAAERMAAYLMDENPEAAAALYAFAAENMIPGDHIRLRQARALIAAGNAEAAERILTQLLATDQGAAAVEMLHESFIRRLSLEEQREQWEALLQRYPGNTYIQRYLQYVSGDKAHAMFDAGEYDKAAAFLEDICRNGCPTPSLEILRLIILMIIEDSEQPAEALMATVKHYPETREPAIALLLQAGEFLEAHGEILKASSLIEFAVKIAPEKNRPWLMLGEILEKLARTDDALKAYREALTKVSETDAVAPIIDERFRELLGPDQRLETWRALVQLSPDNSIMWYHLAVALDEQGYLEEALPLYEEVVRRFPARNDMRVRLGSALARTGRHEAGLEIMEQALSEAPELASMTATSCAHVGDVLFMDAPDQAALFYQRAAQLTPDDPYPHLQLGHVMEQLGRGDSAVKHYREALFSAPDMPIGRQAAMSLDTLLKIETDVSTRIAVWRDIKDMLPEAWLPAERYLMALMDADAVEEGAKTCGDWAAPLKEHTPLLILCAIYSLRSGDMDGAIQRLAVAQPAARQVPEDIVNLVAATAGTLLEKADYHTAERLLLAAEAAQPDNLWHQVRLGEALAGQGRYEEALARFRQVLLQVPDSPHTAAQVDAIYERLGTPDARIREWEALVETHPNSSILLRYLNKAKNL